MIGNMNENVDPLLGFLILARASELRARPFASDKFYLLAAAAAVRALLPKTAAVCRERILRHNPSHAVGKVATMEQALRNADVCGVLQKTEQHYSWEHAEFLLMRLNLSLEQEREQFPNLRAFMAQLLQTSSIELDDCLE
jgi:hypothetical protein